MKFELYTIDPSTLFDGFIAMENIMVNLHNSSFIGYLNEAEKILFEGYWKFWNHYIENLDDLDGVPEIIDYVNAMTIEHSKFVTNMVNKYQIKKIRVLVDY